jgi:hypothetical protein
MNKKFTSEIRKFNMCSNIIVHFITISKFTKQIIS